ncbi:MAG: heme lyase CcmF/NrfE family subunit [Chloroflexota bacterium]
MIGLAGSAASAVGLLGAIVGILLGVRAARRGAWDERLTVVAWTTCGALVAANLLMVGALVGHDFSISYVAQVGSRSTPLLYTIASLWGALEGSILFWSGLLSVAIVLLIARTRGPDRILLPAATATLFAVLAFFASIVVGPGDPWRRMDPVPADGPGPNPLLQNHPLMALHPPFLYLGFVGLAIPYALTVAALVGGRLDDRWLQAVRRWTLGPWVALTLGLVMGAWWSYAVLGWGGYWAWDPVENVALLPWLTATAFLHSAMVQQRRGMLRGWNVGLIAASFVLTILATLVTRSGVLNSVHSFTRSLIGPLFLLLFAIALLGSFILIVTRLPGESASQPRLGTRTTAFLLNNILLVAVTAIVLVGTLFPLFADALAGAQVSVGAPYFERVIGPIAVGLVALVAIGPSLPWGDWRPETRRALLPGATVAVGIVALLLLQGGSPELLAGAAAGSFALVQSAWYIVRRALPARGATDRGPTAAVHRLIHRRRSVGGLVVHLGIALIALVIVASGAGRQESSVTLRTGQAARVGDYEVRFSGTRSEARSGRVVIVGSAVASGPGINGPVAPELTVFTGSAQAIATPAIVPTPGADLYVTLVDIDAAAGTATFRIGIHPFMSWLWLGGGITALGGLVAVWPRARLEPTADPVPAGSTGDDLAGGVVGD